MPLFRFHRGSLEESLKTTIIVEDINELLQIIEEAMRGWINMEENPIIELKIEPYPSSEDNFDSRIGWYTHIVIAKYRIITANPIGFLSEPLE